MDPLYEDIEEKLISDKDFPSPLTSTSSFPSAVEAPCNDGTCIPLNSTSSPWSLSYYMLKLDERRLLQCLSVNTTSNASMPSSKQDNHVAVPPCMRNRTTALRGSKGEKRAEWFPSSLTWTERGILGQLRVAMGCQLLRHTAVTCAMQHTIQKTWSTMHITTPTLPPSPLSCDPSTSSSCTIPSAVSSANDRSSDSCRCGGEEGVNTRGNTTGTTTPSFSILPLPDEGGVSSNHSHCQHLPCPCRAKEHIVTSLFGDEWENMSSECPPTPVHRSQALSSCLCVNDVDPGEATRELKNQEGRKPKTNMERKEKMGHGHLTATSSLPDPPTLSSLMSSSHTECTESVVLVGGASPERFLWVLSDTTPAIQKRTKKELAPHSSILLTHPSPPMTAIPSSSTSVEMQVGLRPIIERSRFQRIQDAFHAWMVRRYLSWTHFFLQPFTPYVKWGGHGSGEIWTNMTPVLFPSPFLLENISSPEDGMGEVRADVQNLIAAHEFCQFFYWDSSALQDARRTTIDTPAPPRDGRIEKSVGDRGVGGGEQDEKMVHHFFSSSSSPATLFSHSTSRIQTLTPIQKRVTHEEILPPLPPRNITTTTVTATTTVSGTTSWWSGFSSFTMWDATGEGMGSTPGLLLHVLLLFPCQLAVGIPSVILTAAKHAFLSIIEETPAADSLVGTLSVDGTWRLECCLVLVMCCLFLIAFLVFTQFRYKKYTNALSHALKKTKKKKILNESKSGTFS